MTKKLNFCQNSYFVDILSSFLPQGHPSVPLPDWFTVHNDVFERLG